MGLLDELPRPADRRIAVRVTADAARLVRGGHPWVFESSITSVSHDGAPGDLAVVFDPGRRFAGIGLWDPRSPIRVKVLHHGDPAPIDDAFWVSRVGAALARRDELAASPATDAYRCVHGENDGLAGLVLDRYSDTAVLKLYTAGWLAHLRRVVPVITELLGPARVVLRLSRRVQREARAVSATLDGTTLIGDPPAGPVRYRENGLVFEADVVAGQKTGTFLDQRENRERVRRLARGARVLDVFSGTGGFTIHAAAGGAVAVHSVDQSPRALATLARNAALNPRETEGTELRSSTGDAFEVMSRLADEGHRYDVVVVDPPAFASRQADVPAARRAYRRLTTLALDLSRPGGVVVQSSCSSRVKGADFFELVIEAAQGRSPGVGELARTGHPPDHPVGFPEGEYLKTLFLRTGGG